MELERSKRVSALSMGFQERCVKLPHTPHIEAFSMEMQPVVEGEGTSPLPLTHDRSVSPPLKPYMRESPAFRRIHMVHNCRIALSVLLLGAGAAIVGCEAHTLHSYNSTHLSDEWFLPLWPQYFDLRPTIGIMIGGAVVAATSLACLVCEVMPCTRPHLTLFPGLLVTLASSLLGLAGAAFAAGYGVAIYTHNEQYGRETLMSWTCQWERGVDANAITALAGTAPVGQNGGISPPAGFGRMCKESHAAFDIALAATVMEILALVISAMGWWMQSRLA